jgi:hypothetical protein
VEFEGARVVGFEVVPFSIKHEYDAKDPFDPKTTALKTCNSFNPAAFDPGNVCL